jgi:hypothetical protein
MNRWMPLDEEGSFDAYGFFGSIAIRHDQEEMVPILDGTRQNGGMRK